jgi:hypothetical protein
MASPSDVEYFARVSVAADFFLKRRRRLMRTRGSARVVREDRYEGVQGSLRE